MAADIWRKQGRKTRPNGYKIYVITWALVWKYEEIYVYIICMYIIICCQRTSWKQENNHPEETAERVTQQIAHI